MYSDKSIDDIVKLLEFAINEGIYFNDEIVDLFYRMIRRLPEGKTQKLSNNRYYSDKVRVLTKNISTTKEFNKIGKKLKFRNEHAVPVSVIYNLLKSYKKPTKDIIKKILLENCVTVTITNEEDKALDDAGLKGKMPTKFPLKTSNALVYPFLRYETCEIKIHKTHNLT